MSRKESSDLRFGKGINGVAWRSYTNVCEIYRAYIDGEDISILKLRRKVDIILPLRSDMKAYEDAIVSAYYHNDGTTKDESWEQHPTREHQQIKRIEHLDYLWDECSVAMISCVVRELKEGKDGSGGRDDYEHMVFGATRLRLTGSQMIRTYELRPEIEEDHR